MHLRDCTLFTGAGGSKGFQAQNLSWVADMWPYLPYHITSPILSFLFLVQKVLSREVRETLIFGSVGN